MGKHNGLPDRMIAVRWKNRDGAQKAYYYNNQSGRLPDMPRSKILLSADRAEAMRRYADLEGKKLPDELRTVAATWEAFKTHPRGLTTRAPRTQKDYGHNWTQLAPVFGGQAWEDVDRVEAIQYLDRRSSRHGANKEIKLLSLLWQFALNRGLTRAPNALARMEYHRLEPRDRYLSDGEYKAVMMAGDQVLRDAMRLAYLTGQRPSDTLRLTWRDVTERDGRTFVLCSQSKTRKQVDVEAGPELVALLSELRERPMAAIRLVILPSGKPASLRMVQDRWKAAAAVAGITDANFADLRAKSASDEQIGATERLGHQDERITKRIYRRTAGKARSTK